MLQIEANHHFLARNNVLQVILANLVYFKTQLMIPKRLHTCIKAARKNFEHIEWTDVASTCHFSFSNSGNYRFWFGVHWI